MAEIYLAGGCFWGTQRFFQQFDGVQTQTGYANGQTENPTYKQVCTQNTGFAETVKITYDPGRISLAQILWGYFAIVDPTSVNRQGNDAGTQYRTGIYYVDQGQLPVIQCMMDWLQSQEKAPVQIQVEPLHCFYPAEDYHQDYLLKNPNGYCHIPRTYFHVQLPSPAWLQQKIPGLKKAEEKDE